MAGESDRAAQAAEVLEVEARNFAKHSGPESDHKERDAFGRDLRTAALRYARAYYAEARTLGLIPEYERVAQALRCPGRGHRNHAEVTCAGSCCTRCGGPISGDDLECRC